MNIFNIFSLIGALLVSPPAGHEHLARSARCAGVTQTDTLHDAAIAAILAHQMLYKSVTVVHSFQAGGWHIYEGSSPSEGENAFLFFKGMPKPSPKAYIWGGSALPDEVDDVRQEVLKHNKGIPRNLATCFAHFVSGT